MIERQLVDFSIPLVSSTPPRFLCSAGLLPPPPPRRCSAVLLPPPPPPRRAAATTRKPCLISSSPGLQKRQQVLSQRARAGTWMDAPDRSSSPRSRQLQGPRPPRLAVSKDSHKVRKPPVAPQQRHHQVQQQQYQHHHQPEQQPRAPVIIYDASPKVIHTKPGDFMALVQRLTGPGAAAAAQFEAGMEAVPSSAVPPPEFLLSPTAALSPAARLAAIERSVRPLPPGPAPTYYDDDDSMLLGLDSFAAVLGLSPRPGILSPAALPPAASTGLFSPMPFDQSTHSWLADLSPFLPSAGTRQAGLDPSFAPSPRGHLLATPTMPSPATFSVLEFFSNFPDM